MVAGSRMSHDIGAAHKMSLLWTQIRECEKAEFEAQAWKRKPESERTYEELWECFKRYLTDVREKQRHKKLMSQANVVPKPKITAAKEEKKKKRGQTGRNKRVVSSFITRVKNFGWRN